MKIRYPEYFGHRLFKRYLCDYAEYFDLGAFIRLNTTVLWCEKLSSGRWRVEYRTIHDGKPKDNVGEFDAVFACTGRTSTPFMPKFPSQEQFKGQIIHSHVYRRPSGFQGLRVAVIGFGNSAADIACELAGHAEEVHLVTRRGGWIIPRYAFGKPAEAFNNRVVESFLPTKLAELGQTALLNLAMGKLPEDIQPKHTIHQANVTVRSDLLENIKVGRIKLHRGDVKFFTDWGLHLSNGDDIHADVIICCTGYCLNFPYISLKDFDTFSSDFPDLYKLIVPPRLPNLFFIGFFELPGPAVPVVETQARWAIAVLTNRIQLPSVEEMDAAIKTYQKRLVKKAGNLKSAIT